MGSPVGLGGDTTTGLAAAWGGTRGLGGRDRLGVLWKGLAGVTELFGVEKGSMLCLRGGMLPTVSGVGREGRGRRFTGASGRGAPVMVGRRTLPMGGRGRVGLKGGEAGESRGSVPTSSSEDA